MHSPTHSKQLSQYCQGTHVFINSTFLPMEIRQKNFTFVRSKFYMIGFVHKLTELLLSSSGQLQLILVPLFPQQIYFVVKLLNGLLYKVWFGYKSNISPLQFLELLGILVHISPVYLSGVEGSIMVAGLVKKFFRILSIQIGLKCIFQPGLIWPQYLGVHTDSTVPKKQF